MTFHFEAAFMAIGCAWCVHDWMQATINPEKVIQKKMNVLKKKFGERPNDRIIAIKAMKTSRVIDALLTVVILLEALFQ